MPPLRTPWQRTFVFSLLAAALVAGWGVTAQASPIGRALARVAESLGKSSDEASRSLGTAAKNVGSHGDDAVDKVLRGLADPSKPPLSTADAIASLEKAGVRDATGELHQAFESLDGAGRRGLTEFLQQSHRAVDVGMRSGMKAGDVVDALQRGGPEAVLAIQAIKEGENVARCLKGFKEFGPDFVTFVRKGDEAAVKTLDEHLASLRKLSPDQRGDVLRGPTKYFDELGKPTRHFDELVNPPKLDFCPFRGRQAA